jgi:hypothetical protein
VKLKGAASVDIAYRIHKMRYAAENDLGKAGAMVGHDGQVYPGST